MTTYIKPSRLRRAKYPFLIDFMSYLKEERGLTSATAVFYQRCVSSMLSRLPDEVTESALLSLTDGYANPAAYRSAWRAFAAWGKQQGLHVPDLKDERRGTKKKNLPVLPPEGRELIESLRHCGSRVADIIGLRWAWIQLASPDRWTRDIYNPRTGDHARLDSFLVDTWEQCWIKHIGPHGPEDFVFSLSAGREPIPGEVVRLAFSQMRGKEKEEETPGIVVDSTGKMHIYDPWDRGGAALSKQEAFFDLQREQAVKSLPPSRSSGAAVPERYHAALKARSPAESDLPPVETPLDLPVEPPLDLDATERPLDDLAFDLDQEQQSCAVIEEGEPVVPLTGRAACLAAFAAGPQKPDETTS